MIFPKILDAIYRFTKVRIFVIPISITFLNPKILGFLFYEKTKWNVKNEASENRREFIR